MRYADAPFVKFLHDLAAKQPTPGGGSASAVGGALGAALASMAANFTIGNEKYKAFDDSARTVTPRLKLAGQIP
jgi:formiminotetrahydrofolate cyclodeaminase